MSAEFELARLRQLHQQFAASNPVAMHPHLAAALPALFDVAAAAKILSRHVDVHREEMPGSIISGTRRLDLAFDRLMSNAT